MEEVGPDNEIGLDDVNGGDVVDVLDGASVPHTAQDGMLTGLDWNFFSTGNSSGCH